MEQKSDSSAPGGQSDSDEEVRSGKIQKVPWYGQLIDIMLKISIIDLRSELLG